MHESTRNTFLSGSGFAIAISVCSLFVDWGLIRLDGLVGLASFYNGEYLMIRGYNGELEMAGLTLPIWLYCFTTIVGEVLYALAMIGVIRLKVWVGLAMVIIGAIGAILWIASISSSGTVKMGPFLILASTIVTIVQTLHYRKVA